jgi:hypothetical protein
MLNGEKLKIFPQSQEWNKVVKFLQSYSTIVLEFLNRAIRKEE